VSPDRTYRGLGDIIVTARPFDEYVAMFDLTDADLLAGAVLDCPAGASGFAHGARARGADVTAVDPVYAEPHADLVERARRDTVFGNEYVRDHPDTYVWGFFRDLDDHRARRLGAVDSFDADRRAHPDRYVAGGLPGLPFDDDAFALVLSSHLLFVYPDHFDAAAHLAAVIELARVASGEVRIFPLVDTTTALWPGLDALRRDLAAQGHASEVRSVPYEFIRGGVAMLVVDGSASSGG
jgi:hypothetical protein